MKKLLIVLMILIAAISTAFAFSACNLFGESNNDGNNDIATTSIPDDSTTPDDKTPDGSKTPDNKAPDSGKAPNNKPPQVNTTPDGKTPDDSTAHVCSFVFKEEVKSCTEPGYELYECSCGKTEKRNVSSPAGHDYKWNTHPATCTTDWWRKGVCVRCGDEKTETVADSKRHTYGEYTSNNDATCSKDGTKTAYCLSCGVANTVTDKGSATGNHAFGAYKSNNDATCSKDGTKTAYCRKCGEADTVTEKGTATGRHNYGEYKSNNDGNCQKYNTATATCATCGATDTKTTGTKGNHDYKWTMIEETCTTESKEGVCTICGDSTISFMVYYDAWFRHDFTWTEIHPATCTADGYRKGTCKKCGLLHTEFIRATGHTPDANNKCTVCGAKVVQSTKDNATAHESHGLGECCHKFDDCKTIVSVAEKYELYAAQIYDYNGKRTY